jgi:hypothetical protein
MKGLIVQRWLLLSRDLETGTDTGNIVCLLRFNLILRCGGLATPSLSLKNQPEISDTLYYSEWRAVPSAVAFGAALP